MQAALGGRLARPQTCVPFGNTRQKPRLPLKTRAPLAPPKAPHSARPLPPPTYHSANAPRKALQTPLLLKAPQPRPAACHSANALQKPPKSPPSRRDGPHPRPSPPPATPPTPPKAPSPPNPRSKPSPHLPLRLRPECRVVQGLPAGLNAAHVELALNILPQLTCLGFFLFCFEVGRLRVWGGLLSSPSTYSRSSPVLKKVWGGLRGGSILLLRFGVRLGCILGWFSGFELALPLHAQLAALEVGPPPLQTSLSAGLDQSGRRAAR